MALAAPSGLPTDIGALLATLLGGTYATLVLAFGTIWILLNVYQYYPLVRAFGREAIDRLVPTRRPTSTEPIANGGNQPVIDLLLPAYEEAGVIEQAIRSVNEATYPPNRLRLHVLTEPDDGATRAALRDLVDRFDFTIYQIPAEYPGEPNKPRALNFGYSLTDGDIVGVIDAEDVVAPDLFERVVDALVHHGHDYALGRLDMANEGDGWLNLLFRAEYGFWYEYLVPAFTAVGYPVPLGGTSCFFHRDVLETCAERRFERFGSPWKLRDQLWLTERGLLEPVPWDPRNVTEDFELGLFLWAEGFEFQYLDAVTAEESPVSLDGWLDQRVRWQKGKLQTFSNYLERPPASLSQKAHVLWQSALPHLGPVNVLGVGIILWLGAVSGVVPWGPLGIILELGLAFIVATTLLFVAGYWTASDRPPRRRLRRAAIVGSTLPVYWLLQWLADIRALADFYRGRFEWISSTHLGRHVGSATVSAAAYVTPPERRAALSTRQLAGGMMAVLGVALILRGVALDRWSLWHDEIYTIAVRGSAPVGELVTMMSDPHPPLYYLIVHGWIAAVGSTPNAMRVLSLAFSLATVGATFLLARRLFGDWTGLLAALLVAISAPHVHFGRTVRMYSLFTLLAVLSWYSYLGLRTDGRCFSWLSRPRLFRAGGYLLVTTGLLYTHVYGVFVVASHHIVEALSEHGHVGRRLWWPLQAVLGLLFLPWAAIAIPRFVGLFGGGGPSPIAWIPPPSLGLIRQAVLLFGGYPALFPIRGGSAAAIAIAGVSLFVMSVGVALSVLTWDGAPDRTYYLVDGREAAMLGIFAGGLFIPFALSYVFGPVFVPRYAIAASIPLFVLVARGLLNVPEIPWRAGLIAVLLVSSLATTGLYHSSETAADWRSVADHLSAEAEPGDLIVFQPTWIREDIDYYAPGITADRLALRPDDRLTANDLNRLQSAAAERETVWLVRHAATDADRAVEVLRERHRLVNTVDGGVVRLYRFE